MAVGSSRKCPPLIETPRLRLRRWHRDDARALRSALDASDDYLRPWIPFMKDEPRSFEQTQVWLEELARLFDEGSICRYGVFLKHDDTLVGENMLIDRVGPGGLEVGYWTHIDHDGHGYASEATCAMIKTGMSWLDMDRIEIHCASGNQASAAIPAKLGFEHEATLKRRALDTLGEVHDLMIWSLFRPAYSGSPAAEMALELESEDKQRTSL